MSTSALRMRSLRRAGLAPAVLVPAAITLGLMLVWAAHDGGFDDTTWYWGALVLLATVAGVVTSGRGIWRRLARPSRIALVLLTLYVAWSYLSMTWAQYPGLALEGSNRALMYLLVFALMTILPWTPRTALLACLTFAIGVGVIALVLLMRMAGGGHIAGLFLAGRLTAPTGYINSTAALFTMQALVAIGLAARRRLSAPLRGLLLALAGASLQLSVTAQSRGWLFTLPVVALVAILVVPGRLRVTAAATIPVLAALVPVRGLLHIYDSTSPASLTASAQHAANPALLACAAAFVLGTLIAWADQLRRGPGLSRRVHRGLGILLTVIAVGGVAGAGMVVSQGHPGQFIARQWHGFTHEPTTTSPSSHFALAGSGRFDFWRVALDAFLSHPVGGLGQDNFGDYYLTHRRTNEEPSWTHSLELRLLAHTGIVGFLLFGGFIAAALAAALRGRRRGEEATRMLVGTMLLPLVVWLIHGSLDWFWEIPALTGPALGFLGAAGGLSASRAGAQTAGSIERRGLRLPALAVGAVGAAALVCATAALAFPYLAAREVSLGTRASASDPTAALSDLRLAASLNPLASDPGRIAGAIALRTGRDRLAVQRFDQSVAAEPGGWFAWLGLGLAESGLGDRTSARRAFLMADRLDALQPAVREALARVDDTRPLTLAEAAPLLSAG